MKTSLTHLPTAKQHELSIIVSVICEKYTVEMIILFGSYARNDWVEELHDDGFHYKYQSDLDIFIVTEKEHLANKIESGGLRRTPRNFRQGSYSKINLATIASKSIGSSLSQKV